MTDVERMEKAIDEVLEEGLKLPPSPPLRPVQNRPQTIAEQVQQLERIELQIDERIRREGVEVQVETERKVGDAHAQYARQLAEETARLARERDEMIRQATDAFHLKMHDLATLLRRRQ